MDTQSSEPTIQEVLADLKAADGAMTGGPFQLSRLAGIWAVHDATGSYIAGFPYEDDANGYTQSRTHIPRLLAHVEALHRFVEFCAEKMFDGEGIDGGDAQDKLEELGLIAKVPGGYDPANHGPEWCIDPGDDYYQTVWSTPEATTAEGGG